MFCSFVAMLARLCAAEKAVTGGMDETTNNRQTENDDSVELLDQWDHTVHVDGVAGLLQMLFYCYDFHTSGVISVNYWGSNAFFFLSPSCREVEQEVNVI